MSKAQKTILYVATLVIIGIVITILLVQESPDEAYERGRQDAERSLEAEELEFIKCWNKFKTFHIESFDSTDTLPAIGVSIPTSLIPEGYKVDHIDTLLIQLTQDEWMNTNVLTDCWEGSPFPFRGFLRLTRVTIPYSEPSRVFLCVETACLKLAVDSVDTVPAVGQGDLQIHPDAQIVDSSFLRNYQHTLPTPYWVSNVVNPAVIFVPAVDSRMSGKDSITGMSGRDSVIVDTTVIFVPAVDTPWFWSDSAAMNDEHWICPNDEGWGFLPSCVLRDSLPAVCILRFPDMIIFWDTKLMDSADMMPAVEYTHPNSIDTMSVNKGMGVWIEPALDTFCTIERQKYLRIYPDSILRETTVIESTWYVGDSLYWERIK